jgi:hypothetical protein
MEQMLSETFPLGDLPIPDATILPWNGAEVKGICRI